MGLFDSLLGVAAPVVGGLLGGPVGAAIGTGVSGLLGSRRSQDIANRGAQLSFEQQLFGQSPYRVVDPLLGGFVVDRENRAIGTEPSIHLQNMVDLANRLQIPYLQRLGGPESDLPRLREIARPRNDALREQLRSQVYNRGRLGFGVGGGRTGQFFNPELAALEEAIMADDLGLVDAARREDTRVLQNFLALQDQEAQLRGLGQQSAALGIGAAGGNISTVPQQYATQVGVNANDAFFGSLGQALGGLFSGGGGSGGAGGFFSGNFGLSGMGLGNGGFAIDNTSGGSLFSRFFS